MSFETGTEGQRIAIGERGENLDGEGLVNGRKKGRDDFLIRRLRQSPMALWSL